MEDWVERFFAAREARPDLSPTAFLAAHPEAPATLRAALAGAADLAAMLGGGEPPRQIGPYAVVRELGRGAMGVVYDVERGGARAALKLLPPWGAASEHARARFRREAEALRRLDHPGLAHVLDAGGDGDAPWLVLERIDGTSLADVTLPLQPEQAATLVAALAEAAAAAHAAGVVHRDIKPANVLLRTGGAPVLIDFGLAALADDAGLTGSGDLLGTPRYMAPEQARGERGDARTDVHALGLVLYELVTGRPARPQPTREGALQAARAGEHVSLTGLQPALPAALVAILRRATAHRPTRRYGSALALAADLRAFAAGRRIRTRAPGRLARAFDALVLGPLPRWSLAGLLGIATIVVGWALSVRARDRAAVAQHVDLALAAYVVGTDAAARALAAAGLQHGDDAMLRGIHDALAPAPPTGDGLGAALVALRKEPAAAAARWQVAEHAAAPVLRAFARLAGGHGGDARDLGTAAGATPLCARLVDARAKALAGDVDAALALLLPAADAEPPARLVVHVARAKLALAHGRLPAGLESARAAARLGTRETRGLTGLLVDLLESAPDRAALRAVLAAALEREPNDAELRFALAYSFDVDHDIVGAAAEYRNVLARAPEHARALVCLAYLHAGADRETCAACARAFTAHAELLDRPEAARLALAALAAAGTRELAVLDAGARVAMAAGATAELASWLATARAVGGELAERLEWWQRRCERASR